MKIKKPRLGAVSACLLLSLAACASKPIVRTETVEVKVPTIVTVPAEMTRVPAEPTLPADATNGDLVEYADALRAWGRELAGKLRKIGGLHESRGE